VTRRLFQLKKAPRSAGLFLLSAAAALSETAGHGFIACDFA